MGDRGLPPRPGSGRPSGFFNLIGDPISSMDGNAAQMSLYWAFLEPGTNRVVLEVAMIGLEGLDGEVKVLCLRPSIRAYQRGILYFTGAEGSASGVYKARSPKAVVVENACVAASMSSAASA